MVGTFPDKPLEFILCFRPLSERQERATECQSRRRKLRTTAQSCAADANGLFETTGSPVLVGELGEGN
jgi:hypothetical protein